MTDVRSLVALALLFAGCSDALDFDDARSNGINICGTELYCGGYCVRDGSLGVARHVCLLGACEEESACCLSTNEEGLLDVPAEYCDGCADCR